MSEKLVVLAKNRAEMMEAQEHSVGWAWNKLQHTRATLAEAEANLAEAKANGWKTTGWQNTRRREIKKVEYYEKIHAALSAGYVIVPNFPIDVFAVRTNRTYPLRQYSDSWNRDRSVKPDILAIGDGEHVDSIPHQLQHEREVRNYEDKLIKRDYYWASAMRSVDFPIKTVKPAILEETSKALLLKIFDEVGCNPGRPGWNPGTGLNRKADPMVIGRIHYKVGGWAENRIVSFLITWWLDFKDITV